MSDDEAANAVELATELTIAWLSNPNNRVAASDVPGFLQRMYETVTGLSDAPASEQKIASEGPQPAVSVRKSLASKDHIISLIDGKPYKSLKRHISRHGFTPEQYREHFGLRSDYPMVAENYAKRRRELALAIGLGSKGRGARGAKQNAKAKISSR